MTSALLGVHLTILAGSTVPVPLPPDVTARIREVTVTESDDERTVFTISFDSGRTGPRAAFDTPMMIDSPVKGNARVVVVLTMGAAGSILVDGIVTQTTPVPGSAARRAEFGVTGHDVSVLLDRHEYSAQQPLDDAGQVHSIADRYLTQGIVSDITDPPQSDQPAPNGRIRTQQNTDWAHLQRLAYQHGFVCYIGPRADAGGEHAVLGAAETSRRPAARTVRRPRPRYRTSPVRRSSPRTCWSPSWCTAEVQDSDLGAVPVRTVASNRPPLAAEPVWAVHHQNVRVRQYRDSGAAR